MLDSVAVPSGPAAADLLPRLSRLLAGDGPAVLPVPADDPREIRRLHEALSPGTPIDDGVALVVATSGTTGVPKGAMLSASALTASATATEERLGGPGQPYGSAAVWVQSELRKK